MVERTGSPESAVTMRLPQATLARIDELVSLRPTRIPRHSWLLEAIFEKLEKEGRVRGSVKVFKEKTAEASTTPTYIIQFFRSDRLEKQPVVPMTVVGDDWLLRYLIEWGISTENALGWIQTLRNSRSILVSDVSVPAERVARYGFKALGFGIQRNLSDGRELTLFPDRVVDRKVGHRIRIDAPHGNKTAIVFADGEVRIIIADHLFPPDLPERHRIEYRTPSEGETAEFLNAYREFVPD